MVPARELRVDVVAGGVDRSASVEAGLGALRRDDGIVLVREPRAKPVTVQLPNTYARLDGSTVSSITLGASEGAVLRRPRSGIAMRPRRRADASSITSR